MAKQTFTTGQVLTAANMTSLQATALGGGAATAKTASYVLVSGDAGGTVAMSAAGATTITVNTGLFAAGDTVFIQNLGAGVCTITAGTATVNTASSLALAQYASGNLYFTAAGASIFSKADGAAAGGGKVLQVVSVEYGTSTSNATTTYQDTGLTLNITPSLATSKILILVSQTYQKNTVASFAGVIGLFRGSTEITDNGGLGYSEYTNVNQGSTQSINFLDSPSTTSEITYKTRQKSTSANNFTTQYLGADTPSQMTLLEIGA